MKKQDLNSRSVIKSTTFMMFLCVILFGLPKLSAQEIKYYNNFLDPSSVILKGLLGNEIESIEKGRLTVLPEWNGGQLIKMFSDEYRIKNKTNDWYGEHAGKWLYTTALAVERTGDPKLKELLFKTADELISYQDKDGYLGSYAPTQRISAKNYKLHQRSWDVWNLTYMTLGLLEVNKYFPNDNYLRVAKNIGELFLTTFGEGKADITNYGTRYGLSATIILESAVELYNVTKDQRYIDFGAYVLKRLNERENLRLFPMMSENRSLELVGDGKIYQSIWNMYAIAKFYELQPSQEILTALEKAWNQITSFHLTPAGGPWGGVGKHLECFNARSYFSPYGLVETCSTMSWIHFNKQMLRLTGEAKYAQEIEKSAYNELIGARFENGIDWNYHSFSNGKRHIANFNDCCPSSGCLALQELSTVAYTIKDNGIACNVYSDSEANIQIPGQKTVKVVQKTNYPFDGNIQITMFTQKTAEFPLFLRIPDWANKSIIKINGVQVDQASVKSDSFYKIDRKWKSKDVVEIAFPFELKVINMTERIGVPQSKDKNIYAVNWAALTRGPLVYALDGLINGTEREEIIQLNKTNPESSFKEIKSSGKNKGVEYQLDVPGVKPMIFMPYYRTGDRKEGSWRITWLQQKID